MVSILNAVDFALLEQGYEIGLNWLGHFARVIIEGVGSIGLGIILFTLVLKAITLPFDIYQRIKMRKQTLIMRNMSDDLEKLQKQYANDKDMYNQKMMELYKKNGYSMFGACLPMILSLVILIVAFTGFRAYSQYANLEMYVNMSAEYNAAILENSVDGVDYSLQKNENGFVVDANGAYTLLWTENGEEKSMPLEWKVPARTGDEAYIRGEAIPVGGNIVYTMTDVYGTSEGGTVVRKYLTVEDKDKYMFYWYSLESDTVLREYKIDTDKLYSSAKAEVDGIITAAAEKEEPETISVETACYRYVVKIGATAAAEWYKGHDAHFLWVKNVWYPDVSYNHPIAEYSTFESQFRNQKVVFEVGGEKVERELSNVFTAPQYENLTSELSAEKDAANGYFILIVLSIGLMVLSQFITMRSQKETSQYQTVDGQGARQQKVMLIVMPLIYALFAFMYSAAFSIYMTMSSLIALLVTLLSNLIIGRIFNKKEEEAIKEQYTRIPAWKKQQMERENGKKERKDRKDKKR